MQVIKDIGAAPIKAWVGTKTFEPATGTFAQALLTRDGPGGNEIPDIEDSALTQLKHIARLPFIHKNGVAVMPDVHAGIGSTVGSVVATTSAIVPAMAGVDLGCGVIAVLTTLTAKDMPDSLLKIRQQIERDVPTGNSMHKTIEFAKDRLKIPPLSVINALGIDGNGLDRIAQQLGTLGGGNHFIEICLDEESRVWVMLHSGSRGIGNKIGSYYINKAKEECARWRVELPHQDLAYLPEGSQFFDDYMAAVEWAQAYAFENRKLMLELVLAAMRRHLPTFELVDEAISCHHNYIARESHFGQNLWVTRKGAVRARADDLGVIPGSMGQRSYIVRGKAHPESYCSCSHGAGRAMSRTAARERFTVADLVAQTEGVECRKDDAILDELPSGYKVIEQVMAQQADLVDVVAVLKQILCVKGA